MPDEEAKDRVKLAVMRLLNETYGITEADFLSAELDAVPAFEARDIGFDRSMIGAYGHDDRVCAYAELQRRYSISRDAPEHTAVCMPRRQGRDRLRGRHRHAERRLLSAFMDDLCRGAGRSLTRLLRRTACACPRM